MNSKKINLRNKITRGKRRDLNLIEDKCSLTSEELEKIIKYTEEQMKEEMEEFLKNHNQSYIID